MTVIDLWAIFGGGNVTNLDEEFVGMIGVEKSERVSVLILSSCLFVENVNVLGQTEASERANKNSESEQL
jgi:hypothetical protein